MLKSGLKLNRGTIVDTPAPNFTKNHNKQRYRNMHQTREINQGYFDMRSHIGVDRKTKLIYFVVATTANTDITVVITNLLHDNEWCFYA